MNKTGKPDLIHGYAAIAAHLGISTDAAKRLVELKGLPTFRQGTGKVLYARPSQLDKFMADQEERNREAAADAQAAENAKRLAPKFRGRPPCTDPNELAAREVQREARRQERLEARREARRVQNDTDQLKRASSGILYGTKEVAAYLGISERSAYHLHETSVIPTFRLGRTVCARRSELDERLTFESLAAPRGPRRYGPRNPVADNVGQLAKPEAKATPNAAATAILIIGHRAIATHLGIPTADVVRLDAERRLPTYQEDGCTVASVAALDHWKARKGLVNE